ncbi:MAG TPA: lipopeptide [Methylothermaceae bacterium]|nr:lipopeptide [Methylothermaceae bacterium]
MFRKRILFYFLAGLVIGLMMASCGQKGPLYLPSPEQEKKQEKR